MQISPARRAAFEILQRVENADAYSSALLAATDRTLNTKDRALCHELVLGVLRRRLWLDRCIEHFGSRRIERLDPPVLLSARLGLYQLRFLSRVPPSAAVNESVNLVREAKLKSAAGFVNALLRRATREPDYDPAAEVADPIERLTIETSHPRWLIERWISQFGFIESEAIARANNTPAPLAFRFTARTAFAGQTGAIIDELQAAGAEPSPSLIVPNGWRVARPTDRLRELAGDGLIYFQDEGSQLAALLLGAQAGERVLDVCAAPGSKATLLAALAPEAVIVAGDLHEHRARTIKELAGIQHARNVLITTHDATDGLPFPANSFDRVLVDVPCSGTGTLRHNPEIRWRLKPGDIAELASKQKRILMNASALVRPGGRIVYSTCSLDPEENEAVVDDFSEMHPDFEPQVIEAPPGSTAANKAVRTWPQTQDVDGFFVAAFRRVN